MLAIGAGLGAGYLLSIFFEPNSPIVTWQVNLLDLNFLAKDLTVRLNATFFVGAAIVLCVFAIQHRGVLRTAQISTILTVASLLPLFIVCVIPLLEGNIHAQNFLPFTPLAVENGQVVPSDGTKRVFGFSSEVCSSLLGQPTRSRPLYAT